MSEEPKQVIVIGCYVREAEHHVRQNWAEFHGQRPKVMSSDLAGKYGLQGLNPKTVRLIVLSGIPLRAPLRVVEAMDQELRRLKALGMEIEYR